MILLLRSNAQPCFFVACLSASIALIRSVYLVRLAERINTWRTITTQVQFAVSWHDLCCTLCRRETLDRKVILKREQLALSVQKKLNSNLLNTFLFGRKKGKFLSFLFLLTEFLSTKKESGEERKLSGSLLQFCDKTREERPIV